FRTDGPPYADTRIAFMRYGSLVCRLATSISAPRPAGPQPRDGLQRALPRHPLDRRHLAEFAPELAPRVAPVVAAIEIAVAAGAASEMATVQIAEFGCTGSFRGSHVTPASRERTTVPMRPGVESPRVRKTVRGSPGFAAMPRG